MSARKWLRIVQILLVLWIIFLLPSTLALRWTGIVSQVGALICIALLEHDRRKRAA